MYTVVVILFLLVTGIAHAQQGAGPEIPIVLEHADSIVGAGPFETSVRTFYGNVRFQQGNVTGRCDRAIHNVMSNTVELFGNVVVKQGALTMRAPEVRYSGARFIATAPRGIRVEQDKQVITAKRGHYSTNTHIAEFFDEVFMHDDTTSVWSDTMIYDRDIDTMRAVGSVVGFDSTDNAWFEAEIAQRKTKTADYVLTKSARIWKWEPGEDTMFVAADTIHSRKRSNGLGRMIMASGSAVLIKGATSASAGVIDYNEAEEKLVLQQAPYVWSDSIAFTAQRVSALIPERKLSAMTGTGDAILMSLVQGSIPSRYDQISGDRIDLTFHEDSLRALLSSGSAQSITFRGEAERQDGLAKVACDSIRAVFNRGELSDVFWLGGIAGEHHPERLVAGREAQFLLPKFHWRTDEPMLPRPKKRNQR